MNDLDPRCDPLIQGPLREFRRRDSLPLKQDVAWQITSGSVRTFTWHEDGTVVTLGLWGKGDIVGYPFIGAEPYSVECLNRVQTHCIHAMDIRGFEEIQQRHLHQSQLLFQMRFGKVYRRFKQFLLWQADRLGEESQDGETVIPLGLTHQDIADAIGSTRVSVTRLVGELERKDILRWSNRCCWVRPDELRKVTIKLTTRKIQ